MIDFKASFALGIEAAKVAEKNKIEIQSVFDEVNKQLSEVTGGVIYLDRKKYYVNNILQDMAAIANVRPREIYWAIVAINQKYTEASEKELAKWDMDKNGYPARIFIDNYQVACEDKKALEKALQRLLCDATVGEKLYTLINFQPTSADD